MDVFTSISLDYLPKARILASSVKRLHPDWTFHLLVSDRLASDDNLAPAINLSKEPFDRIVWIDALEIDNLPGWIFKHTTVETCTAVKGPFLRQLVNEGAEKIMYLDPDIVVFNSLRPLEVLLDDKAILLTPHLLDYSDDQQSILDNEIAGVMRHGIFNLGFVAINSQRIDGTRFAHWWSKRLLDHCYADYDQGLFTDQKWCDLVPAYFSDYHVVRDPGYNVASWNIDRRHVSMSDEGQIQIDGKYPLRFYHFTGYDSGDGAGMTQRYSGGNQVVDEIWAWYGRSLEANEQSLYHGRRSYYDYYDNGVEIPKDARKIYRQREDLQNAFPDPFGTEYHPGKDRGGFSAWYVGQ